MCHNFSCVTLNLLAISRSSTVLDETAHPSTASYLLLHLLRRITKQPELTTIIQSQHLSIFGQIAHMDDDADAKMILLAPLQRTGRDHQGVLVSRG